LSQKTEVAKEPQIGKYLDDEERELIGSFENYDGPLKSLLTPESKREYEAMARATMNTARTKISLRVPARDLMQLKARALQEGIPYQTLINSLIHKYVSYTGP
jgi:predicted DNA binding CopG/RHH family protein